MPTFTFTAPNGKTYDIEAPEGTTPEQAFKVLQGQIDPQATPGKEPALQDPVASMAGVPQRSESPQQLRNAAQQTLESIKSWFQPRAPQSLSLIHI